MREAGNLQGQALALLNVARLQEFQGNILAACEAWQEVSMGSSSMRSYGISTTLCDVWYLS